MPFVFIFDGLFLTFTNYMSLRTNISLIPNYLFFYVQHQYLHAGNVAVVENSACQKAYPNYAIDDDTICAFGTVAFCYGDEGIAFTLNGEMVGMAYGAKDVLTPVEECPIIPQTYLSIDKYLDWIKANSDYQDGQDSNKPK